MYTIYNTNVDLVNDDVYTKFGLILSIRSQDCGRTTDGRRSMGIL